MKEQQYTVKTNEQIASSVYKMVCAGDASVFTAPGQFINIKLDSLYLRRPISISDWNSERGTITLVYKDVGTGTAQMSRMLPGATMNVLSPLGNGFDTTVGGPKPLVIGGGVIPEADIAGLKAAGIAEVFTPGTPTTKVVDFIKANVK